ncbi:MAG: glycosyltransferase family 1 protein [Actinomycetota bacterium]|nr:glycosyltransferase family 1 protein [Actinomycetota bacterium]MDD5666449.1 glycosyltransferase family 1 protein [Actinomycetota bacterium]
MKGLRVGLDGRALGNVNRLRGIGRYTARLVEGLARAGDDIHFVLFGYGGPPGEDLIARDAMDGLEWHEIPRVKGPPLLAFPGEHLTYAREIEKAGVDIFHGIDHNMVPFLRCPSLITVHDLILLVLRGPYLGPTAWLWMWAHRRAARGADMVIAVSENTARDVQRIWGIPPQRIAVVHEGVTPDYAPVEDGSVKAAALERYGIEGPYFLYLGGFDPRKNLRNMLLAFKRFARAAGDGPRLVLAGDFQGFEGYVGDELEELGMEDMVSLPGFVEEGDLPALYSGAACFLCLSLYEGFGLPLLEAMACGSPVLASRVSSIPEVVGDAGLLVDPLDPGEIARGMETMWEGGREVEELREKGLRRASGFTWEKSAATIIGLYDMVSGGRCRS